MQFILKTLIVAMTTSGVLLLQSPMVQAQTTGPGDRTLVNMGVDRNYNCARNDAGQCLPETAVQMGPIGPNFNIDIPLMPSAGGGGMSTDSAESVRLNPSMESEALVESHGMGKKVRPDLPTKTNTSAVSDAFSESGISQIVMVFMARISKHHRGRRYRR